MDRLLALQAFARVVELGGFTRAGDGPSTCCLGYRGPKSRFNCAESAGGANVPWMLTKTRTAVISRWRDCIIFRVSDGKFDAQVLDKE